MKKLVLIVAPVVLALTGCVTPDGSNSAGATSQQLGMAALNNSSDIKKPLYAVFLI